MLNKKVLAGDGPGLDDFPLEVPESPEGLGDPHLAAHIPSRVGTGGSVYLKIQKDLHPSIYSTGAESLGRTNPLVCCS